RPDKGAGRGCIIGTIKKSEMTRRIVVALKMAAIDLCRDAADGTTIAIGDEALRHPEGEERIVLGGNSAFLLQGKRRNPGWIVSVNCKRKAQPVIAGAAVFNSLYANNAAGSVHPVSQWPCGRVKR